MHSLIKKLAFVIALTVLSGCSTFLEDLKNATVVQNTSSSVKEPQVPKKTAPQKPEYDFSSEETIKPLPPLLSGGTKPLLTEELMGKVDFPPDPEDDIPPCIDPKTRKEKSFLLADLRS